VELPVRREYPAQPDCLVLPALLDHKDLPGQLERPDFLEVPERRARLVCKGLGEI